MNGERERRFELFGSVVRLLAGAPGDPHAVDLELIAIEAQLRVIHDRLTRFDADSELSRLNADPREAVPVSPVLATAVRAALWAAERTAGLVDPTLLGGLERAGYAESRRGRRPGPLAEALAAAPERGPAAPAPGRDWARVHADLGELTVQRPPGVRLDLGGSAKGWAADLAAERLGDRGTFAVDAGGDLRVGGASGATRRIDVDHPLDPERAVALALVDGAVATSGLRTRVWRHGGGFSHHLIDPSTGRPAWTGVIQATALAPTALEAEALAKGALLAGPDRGVELLEPLGGLLVLDDGDLRVAGSPPLIAAGAREEVAV